MTRQRLKRKIECSISTTFSMIHWTPFIAKQSFIVNMRGHLEFQNITSTEIVYPGMAVFILMMEFQLLTTTHGAGLSMECSKFLIFSEGLLSDQWLNVIHDIMTSLSAVTGTNISQKNPPQLVLILLQLNPKIIYVSYTALLFLDPYITHRWLWPLKGTKLVITYVSDDGGSSSSVTLESVWTSIELYEGSSLVPYTVLNIVLITQHSTTSNLVSTIRYLV